MLSTALEKFGSLLEIEEDELAVFIADAGLPSEELFANLRSVGYEPVMPYNYESKEDLVLKDMKLISGRRDDSQELDLRRDGTPLCPLNNWDKSEFEGGRRPLVPLPSHITSRMQRWRCPMDAVGECLTPCALAPYYKDDRNVNMLYRRVKKSIANLGLKDGFRFLLFPRIGAEAQELLSYRGRVENDFSIVKGRGCFGGDGEARLPVRGEKRLKLRLLCTLIPLVALAMVEFGCPCRQNSSTTGSPRSSRPPQKQPSHPRTH